MSAMDSPSSGKQPITRILAPQAAWQNHVRATILRDTRGCDLTAQARLNRFPASSHCVITWFIEGAADLIACGPDNTRLSGCVVSGCQTVPTLSSNPGDVHALMVMFYPDAFHALFGIDLCTLQNRFVDARAVMPPHGIALIDAVFAAHSEEERCQAVDRFLLAHATQMPSSAWMRLRQLGSRITLSLASAMLGVGERQSQRVALRQNGLNLQSLQRLWRGERSFISAQRQRLRGEPIELAKHAMEHEYADQSHFVRECKSQTGRTPSQLIRDVQTEEADWVYRLQFASPEENH